ncbi:MAG: hypothetical protein MJ252_04715 [archaeon]|nr:hypothetical protein [archaeon]
MASDENTYSLKKMNFGLAITWKTKDLPTAATSNNVNSVSIKPDEKYLERFTTKNPKSVSFTNIVEKSAHSVHTEKNPTKTITISHVEGGWPEYVISDPEPEKIAREKKGWVRAKEKTPNFAKTIDNLCSSAEFIFKQNQLMDVYEEYFENQEVAVSSDVFEAKVEMVYKDTEPYKRIVNKVVWNVPEEKVEQRKIAVAYRLNRNANQEIPPDYVPPALVWDVDKPNAPTNVLRVNSNTEIVTLAFNNKFSHILGVGCANGTAGFFNLQNNKYVGWTKVEASHTEPITEFVWMKSRNSNEFVTCSTDGSIRWWEIQEKECLTLLEGYTTPVEINCLKPLFLTNTDENDITKDYGGTRIDNNSEAGATKFLIATEQGAIFVVNKKKNEGEMGQKLGLNGGNHLGPIVGMQRNPSSFKFILTVGDWTARIWTEDLKTPIYISKYHPSYLSDCLWTPRVGMFLISRSDGWINGYDLCYKLNEPCFSYKVTESPLTTMALSSKGDKLLVGDEEGKISMVKLSESFYYQGTKEELDIKKNNLGKFFENEQTREKILTTVKKVIQKKAVEGQAEKEEKARQEKIDQITEKYINETSEITGIKNPEEGEGEEGEEGAEGEGEEAVEGQRQEENPPVEEQKQEEVPPAQPEPAKEPERQQEPVKEPERQPEPVKEPERQPEPQPEPVKEPEPEPQPAPVEENKEEERQIAAQEAAPAQEEQKAEEMQQAQPAANAPAENEEDEL